MSAAEIWAGQNARRPRWSQNPLQAYAVLRSGLKETALTVVTSVADAVQPGEVIVSGTLTVATAAGIAGLRGGRVVALNPAPMKARDCLAAVNQAPTVYGVSPALMPADPAWPAHVKVTGHLLRADPEPVIPEGLPEFLAEHPGVVYVGFGSMGNAVRQSGLDRSGS